MFTNKGSVVDKGAIYVVVILTLLIFGAYIMVGGTLPTKLPKPNNNLVAVQIPANREPTRASLQLYTFFGATLTPYPTQLPMPTLPANAPKLIDCGGQITGSQEAEIIWNYSLDVSPAGGNQLALKAFYTDERALLLGSGAVSPMTGRPEDHITNPNIGNAAIKDIDGFPYFPAVFITDITNSPGAISGDAQAGGQPNKPDDVYGAWKAAGAQDPIPQNGPPPNIAPNADAWPFANGPGFGAHGYNYTAEIIWKATNLKASDSATPQLLPLQSGHKYRAQIALHNGEDPSKIGLACINFTMPNTPNLPTPSPVNSPITTSQPSLPATPPVNQSKSWQIQSVDAMKVTKDVICSQSNISYINSWLDKAVEIGATHVAISTPYDNPPCGDAVAYTKTWVNAIRQHGLNVWFRQMPLAFEGIYDTPKNASTTYLDQIKQYIITNKDNYKEGDVFTPIPEPQNGGIQGFSYCAQNTCIFSSISSFNQWLRDAINISNQAFTSVGLGGKIKIGYYGFDGFVAWGDNNPDWQGKGILEDATVQAMGNVTIDHYPEAVGSNMSTDLKEAHAKFPGVPIIIGEWGTISGGNVQQQVQDTMGAAAADPLVVGFNYWVMAPGANEALLDDNLSNKSHFQDVQSFYKK